MGGFELADLLSILLFSWLRVGNAGLRRNLIITKAAGCLEPDEKQRLAEDDAAARRDIAPAVKIKRCATAELHRHITLLMPGLPMTSLATDGTP